MGLDLPFLFGIKILMIVNKIIIVGGGSAGWMTAATLIRLFPNKKITLIESADTPVVGVGESTLGFINHWLQLLKIKDEDFMKECDATYKLSIKFNNFYHERSGSFHYPFGDPYEAELPGGKNAWYFKKLTSKLPLAWTDYASFLYPAMSLVKHNRFGENINGDLNNFDLAKNSAYHFDAIKFGQVLKNKICIPEGVEHIIDDIKTCQRNERGYVIGLNDKYAADLYIDCTGFKSLLLGEMMKVPFISYNDLLPNDSALAGQIPYTDKEKELVAYTECSAIQNGWVWRIPSWNKIGTGYVYSSKYVDDKQAEVQMHAHMFDKWGLDTRDTLELKKINMRVGRHKDIFYKNVCAIGLSAGFIEPLESNGLFTVHQFLLNLARTLHQEHINQFERDSFNHRCNLEFDRFAEFVAMHYYLSNRKDTKYWRDLQDKQIIDLKKQPSMDINNGLNLKVFNNYDSNGGMHCVGTGMRQLPIDPTEICLQNDITDFEKFTKEHIEPYIVKRDNLVKAWDIVAQTKPKLIDVLKKIHEGN